MTDRLDRIESQLEALTTAVTTYIEHNENERQQTNAMLQSFIDEGKASRAQSQREMTAFRETMNAMITQISARLNQIADRIEQLWERINAA